MPPVDHSTTVPDLKAASSQPPPIVTNKMPPAHRPSTWQTAARLSETVTTRGWEALPQGGGLIPRIIPPSRPAIIIDRRSLPASGGAPTRASRPMHPAIRPSRFHPSFTVTRTHWESLNPLSKWPCCRTIASMSRTLTPRATASPRWYRAFVGTLLAMVGSDFGRVGWAASPTMPTTADHALRQRVEYGYNPGIVVGLVNRNGRTIRTYGRRARWMEGAPDSQTIYEIGSVTKTFTAALLADAVVRGEVGLDDPVQSLLPATVRVPRAHEEIRLRHLATHRSGLLPIPDNLASTKIREPFAGYDVDRLHEFLARYVLTREPGAAWEYSNLGFGLLGHALAQRSGREYEDLLRARILQPLGLTATGGTLSAAPAGRKASGYSGVVPVPPFQMPAMEGAGVLRSSMDDLLTYLEFHLGFRESQDLSAALRETHRPQGPTTYPGVSIGLAWLRVTLPGGLVLQHDGETPGFTAFVGFRPDPGLGVAILSNARINARSGIVDVGLHLLDSAYPLTSVPRPAAVEPSLLASYAGVYRRPDGDVFELGISADRLVLYHVRSDFEFTLYPQSSTRFDAPEIEVGNGASAQFRTNSAGTVTRLDWTQSGQTLAYARQGEPARVQLLREAGEVQIAITGGGEANYRVEASADLRQWEVLGMTRTGSDSIPDPAGGGQSARFYRAVRIR